MSLFLARTELQELTGRCRFSAQARVLRSMGIEHKIRADGRPLVLRSHVEKQFGGYEETARREPEPNWSAIN